MFLLVIYHLSIYLRYANEPITLRGQIKKIQMMSGWVGRIKILYCVADVCMMKDMLVSMMLGIELQYTV